MTNHPQNSQQHIKGDAFIKTSRTPLLQKFFEKWNAVFGHAKKSALDQAERTLVVCTPISFVATPSIEVMLEALKNQTQTPLYYLESSSFPDAAQIDAGLQGHVRGFIYRCIANELLNKRFVRILVIPTCPLDIAIGIAAADITGAPMAVVFSVVEGLADLQKLHPLLAEATAKAVLILSANEELRTKLQSQFGERVWQLPNFDKANAPLEGQASENTGRTLAWIWDALARGRPSDEAAPGFTNQKVSAAPYVDAPAPSEIHWEMRPHFLALERLRNLGYVPEFVLDVGAATGYWSHICQQIFPNSKFYLFEPLLSEYQRLQGALYRLHPEFVVAEVAVSNRCETITFNIAPDLYGSSFLADSGAPTEGAWKHVQVSAKTLAELAIELSIKGRGLMKIDVQFAEHLVLEGAHEFLAQIDVIFVELSLARFHPEAKTFGEMLFYLRELGFEYFDMAGWWRRPDTGQLIQQDAVFARQSLSKLRY